MTNLCTKLVNFFLFSIVYSQVLSVSGAILTGFSKTARNYEMIIVGRLLIGIACGLFTGDLLSKTLFFQY